MSEYVDSFAHDLFPDIRDLKEFALVKRPILALLSERVAVGKTYSYPALAQGATAMGTDRAAVDEVAGQAGDVANFDGYEFTLGYFKPGYKAGFEIDEFDMAVTEGSGGVPDGAYMEAFANRLRSLIRRFGSRMERYFVGKSGKSLARTTANGGTTDWAAGTVQLSDPTLIRAFNRHQVLHASLNDASTPSSAALLGGSAADQKIYVRAIDADNGTLHVSATSGGSLGHAAMNTAAGVSQVYLFNYSDFQGTSGHTPNVLPPGLQDWITTSWSPALGDFHGVNRGDYSELAGWRLTAQQIQGLQLDGIIELALERAFQLFGADGDGNVSDEYVVAMSPRRWTQLSQIAKARGYRMLNGETAYFGYRYIEIVHGQMTAKCLAVPSMSSDDLFFLQFEDDGWVVRHLSGWPKVMNGDGLQMLRLVNDRYSMRLRSFFHWGCNGINRNGRVDISQLAL